MKKGDENFKITIRLKDQNEINDDQAEEMWSQLFNVLGLFKKEDRKLNMKYDKHFGQQVVQ